MSDMHPISLSDSYYTNVTLCHTLLSPLFLFLLLLIIIGIYISLIWKINNSKKSINSLITISITLILAFSGTAIFMYCIDSTDRSVATGCFIFTLILKIIKGCQYIYKF